MLDKILAIVGVVGIIFILIYAYTAMLVSMGAHLVPVIIFVICSASLTTLLGRTMWRKL